MLISLNCVLVLSNYLWFNNFVNANKDDKEKQCSNICQLWESINKSIEQDSQVLIFTDDFENSADSLSLKITNFCVDKKTFPPSTVDTVKYRIYVPP